MKKQAIKENMIVAVIAIINAIICVCILSIWTKRKSWLYAGAIIAVFGTAVGVAIMKKAAMFELYVYIVASLFVSVGYILIVMFIARCIFKVHAMVCLYSSVSSICIGMLLSIIAWKYIFPKN